MFPSSLGRPWFLSACLGLVLLPFATASAQYPQYLVNDDVFGEENRFDPAATPLPDGGYLCAWLDNGRGHPDVLARRFAANGEPAGDPVRLNDDTGLVPHLDVDLSAAANGEVLAVWADGRGHGQEIYARRIDAATGAPIGAEFAISSGVGLGSAERPRVATQADGSRLIVWTERPGTAALVTFQLLAPDGSLNGENQLAANDFSEREQAHPVAAPLGDGRWLVAWDEQHGAERDVHFRFVNDDGRLLGTVHRANSDQSGKDQFAPAALATKSRFLLAWRDDRDPGSDVYGRWYLENGDPVGPESTLREATDPAADNEPRLVPGLDGGYALVWLGGTVDAGSRTFFRFFDANGSPRSGSASVADAPRSVIMRGGAAVPRTGGNWVLFWSDSRSLTTQVYRQEHLADGSRVGEAEPVWLRAGSAAQLYPDVALFPDGAAVVAYGDIQSGLYNIRARLLDTSGRPTGESFPVNDVPVGHGFETINGVDEIVPFVPSVAACSTGFVVTWAVDLEGGRLQLWGQLFDRQHQRIGGNFEVAPASRKGTPQYDPRPEMFRDGRFVVSWRDNSIEEGGDIWLQRFSADGLRNGDPVNVADDDGRTRASAQQLPAITVSPFDELAVSWIDRRYSGWDIFLQLYSPFGDRVGNNQPQHAVPDGATNDQIRPDVGMASDRYVTVFEDQPLTEGAMIGKLTILETLRRDGGAGTQTPAATEVAFDVTPGERNLGNKYPQIAMDETGRFLVTWWDNVDDQARLYAQRFSPLGERIGLPYDLSEGTAGSRLQARLDVQGDIIQLVWTDSRRERGWDIYTRRVDWSFAGGPVPILLSGLQVSSSPEGLVLQWRTPGAADRAFSVWREAAETAGATPSPAAVRLNPEPLFAEGGVYRYLDRSAPLGQPFAYYLESPDDEGHPEYYGPLFAEREGITLRGQAAPNPFVRAVSIPRALDSATALEVLDVTGRVVRRLNADTGADRWVWRGEDESGRPLPGGIYWARPAGATRGERLIKLR